MLYRSIGWGDVYRSLRTSARITISIGMLIAGALVFNYVITAENIPRTLSAALKAYELSPWSFLLAIPLVLFALVSDTSIGYLFLGGVIPGLLIGAAQMALIAYTARKRNFPVEAKVPLRELPRITWEAFPALLMPVILFGLLYSGITTPTEAAW